MCERSLNSHKDSMLPGSAGESLTLLIILGLELPPHRNGRSAFPSPEAPRTPTAERARRRTRKPHFMCPEYSLGEARKQNSGVVSPAIWLVVGFVSQANLDRHPSAATPANRP